MIFGHDSWISNGTNRDLRKLRDCRSSDDMTGGASRLGFWAQLLAAALNQPLTYRTGSEIGAALGAARLGRMAATGESPAAVCRLPPIVRVIAPDPHLAALLAQRRGHFQQLYRDLRNLFQESAT